jgi:hypothetical protein
MKQKDNYQPSAIFFHTLFGWSLTGSCFYMHLIYEPRAYPHHETIKW